MLSILFFQISESNEKLNVKHQVPPSSPIQLNPSPLMIYLIFPCRTYFDYHHIQFQPVFNAINFINESRMRKKLNINT